MQKSKNDMSTSEINKLKEVLKKLPQEKNEEKKREVLKKVIAYMTLGVDVSKLFPDIIMISNTNDIIQKKMIYLYLNNYAETNSELSLLTINTLQKDSKDDDPIIRGLALRSFCNLRINNLFEYIEGPLFNGLNDKNSYVRRIAIISCVKLIKMNPQIAIKNDVIKILKNKLLDKDSQCIINAVHALNEILVDEGGLKVNKEIIFNMLNKISTFNEWGKCVVLNIVSTYIPENEDEMYDIMNILENHIRDFSSAVFLSCLKCFLNFSANDTNLQIQIFQRMKDPLLTLISTSSYEISYIVLLHTNLLLHEANKLNYNIFDYDYKHFFFRYNDLTYIKDIKLDILVSVATKNNLVMITNELSEYIYDQNVDIARKAIYSIGCIALKIPKAISKIVELALSSFLPMNHSYICSATIEMLANILRKYEEYTKVIIEEIIKHDNKLIDNDGIRSYIWIVGEYSEYIENAPYILEEYVTLTDCSYLFMLELLTACVKVLYRRPSEMVVIIASLFDNILKNYKYPELTDKVHFYYKLLSYNYEEAFKIIVCKKKLVKNFCESNENILLDKLFNEFNTLSVLYKQPIYKFVEYSKIRFGGTYDPEENEHDPTRDHRIHMDDAGVENGAGNIPHVSDTDRESFVNSPEEDARMGGKYPLSSSDTHTNHYNNRTSGNLPNMNEDMLLMGDDDTDPYHHSGDKHNANGHTHDHREGDDLGNDHLSAEAPKHLNKMNTPFSGNVKKSLVRGSANNATTTTAGSNPPNSKKLEKKKSHESINATNSDHLNKLSDILIDAESINPEHYQEQWSILPEQNNEKLFLRKNYYNLQLETIDEFISKYNIVTLASGEIDQCLKFYMYAQFYTKQYIFIEIIFNKAENSINWILKSQCEDSNMLDRFTDYFRDIFMDFM
ncbi:Adapter-related protein complex 4 beta 1 subunit [Plasmodium coatneyi]|uniref:Adapter-related protein complex 4 beta 1 subunit n=1 Tax=Plasmodium coatneyi TaxID=208452 RepID=A0A1B1DT46_9APIC|nr:Adapter-related protein complex 4 beta 1 subunit [Plasmodium coatneyi]ANQ05914.1 Adapter-related protein complex 4 beta 1 subunit [Plasmodium coatneyi]